MKYVLAVILMFSMAAFAQQAAPGASVAKPSKEFIAAYAKRAIWIDVRTDAQATLKVADDNIKRLEEPMVKEITEKCPGCSYNPDKQEFVKPAAPAGK